MFLCASIILAVLGLSFLKGMEQSWPWAGLFSMYALFIVAYYLRAKAVMQIPVVVAYAVWEAAGLALVILVGIVLFQEYFGFTRVIGMVLLLAGSYLVHLGTEKGQMDGPPGVAGMAEAGKKPGGER